MKNEVAPDDFTSKYPHLTHLDEARRYMAVDRLAFRIESIAISLTIGLLAALALASC